MKLLGEFVSTENTYFSETIASVYDSSFVKFII